MHFKITVKTKYSPKYDNSRIQLFKNTNLVIFCMVNWLKKGKQTENNVYGVDEVIQI